MTETEPAVHLMPAPDTGYTRCCQKVPMVGDKITGDLMLVTCPEWEEQNLVHYPGEEVEDPEHPFGVRRKTACCGLIVDGQRTRLTSFGNEVTCPEYEPTVADYAASKRIDGDSQERCRLGEGPTAAAEEQAKFFTVADGTVTLNPTDRSLYELRLEALKLGVEMADRSIGSARPADKAELAVQLARDIFLPYLAGEEL